MFRRLLPLLAVPFGFACVEPAAPNDTTPPTANLDALPEIPRPVSLTDFGASKSEVQTEVRLLAGDFRPEIDEVTADWAIQAQRLGVGAQKAARLHWRRQRVPAVFQDREIAA